MSASRWTVPSLEDRYRDARALLRARRFEEAETAWGAIAERVPGEPEAIIAMGRACARLGRDKAALLHFAAVPWPETMPLRLIKAYASCLAVAVGRQPEAARTILAGIDITRHVAWARLLEANGLPSVTAGLYRTLFLLSGQEDLCRQFVACLQRHGHVGEAVVFLAQHEAQRPTQRWFYLFKATFLCGVDKAPAAQRTLRAGIAVRPDDVRLRIRLARLLMTRQRWHLAIRTWREIGLLMEDPARINLEIADCQRRVGLIDRAVETYRRALRDEANRGERAYFGYTKSLRLAGRGDEAVGFLRALTADSPRDIAAWSNLVYALEQMDRYGDALAALDQARQALGDAPAMVCAAARIAERGSFFDMAERILTEAPATLPGAVEVRLELGRFLLRRGMVADAGRVFRDAERTAGSAQCFTAEQDRIGTMRKLLRINRSIDDDDTVLPEAAIRHIVTLRRSLIEAGIPGRIAIVSPIGAIGGAERQAVLTATALSELCRPVESVSFHAATLRPDRRDNPHLNTIASAPIAVTSLPPRGFSHLLGHAAVAPHRELLDLLPRDLAKATAAWLVEFKTRRPAVVHAWQDVPSVAGTLAAILAGVPRIVMSLRSSRPSDHRRLRRYMRSAYLQFLEADGIVMSNNSQSGAADYEDWLGIERGRVQIVRNGVDGRQLDRDWAAAPGTIRQRLNLPGDAIVVGGAFRLIEDKRPLLWIDAAAQVARSVPNTHFLICGGGALSNDMRRRAGELGIGERFHLAGEQWPIAPWYRAMDLFMLASGREGMPNVLLEAQFLRVPVVSSAVGGVREVLQPGRTGWAVDDADASRLAERVIWSLGHPEWLREAGRAARDFVEQSFSVTAMVAATLDLYQL